MTTIDLDQFEERLMQRADAEQNIANRLYQGNASKDEYMKSSVTASVLREVASSIAQMKEEFTVTTVAPEKQNVEVYPRVFRDALKNLVDKLTEFEVRGDISLFDSLEASMQNAERIRDATEGPSDRQYPGTEVWELEQLVEAKDERIHQLEAKVENLEGHLSNADKNIEKLEKRVSYFKENRNWIDDNFQKLSDKYAKFRDILRDRSQQLIHELNGVSNSLDLDAVRCRNLAEDMLLLSKGEIRAADAERLPDPKKVIMDASIDHFLDIVEDFDAEMLRKMGGTMSPRVYNILRKTIGWTVRDVYEEGFKLKGFGKKSMQEFESLVDKMVEIAHEEN